MVLQRPATGRHPSEEHDMSTRPQIQNAGLNGTREPGPLGALEFERILATEGSVARSA